MNFVTKDKRCVCDANTTTGIQIGDCATTGIQIDDAPCCGLPAAPPGNPNERPGYILCHYVDSFLDTAMGAIPRVSVSLDRKDYVGSFLARLGAIRNDYKLAPGLYGVGLPNDDSQVLVTANYKLTFDALRKELKGLSAWILVLDTRGINVWCAAGKGTFSTAEVINQVRKIGLERLVRHKELILPQLSATGVSAIEVKKGCGFKVIWGPVRAKDLRTFINNRLKATKSMRAVTFAFVERLVLIPVELYILGKSLLKAVLIVFFLSGIGPGIFSFGNAISRGLMASSAIVLGILSGAVGVPALLPWIPGRAFSVKGLLAGGGASLIAFFAYRHQANGLELIVLVLLVTVVSSYLGMNFTGSTPYTSPTGVELEMRRAIPIQIVALVIAAIMWVYAAFI